MKRLMKFFILILFIAAACREKEKDVLEVFATSEGAINGYDPVSYYKESKPVKGAREYSYEWKNVTWYFASKENLSTFKTNPGKYAPQFGGYCAYGMAKGHKASTEPDAWTIVDDKLYLNHNRDVLSKWKGNQNELIKQADGQWPNVKQDPF